MCRLFFTDFHATVQNNGYTSDDLIKTRGVNQGCPISPYLFLVCSEVMAHKIKEHPKIHGIKMGEIVHMISQFADDTLLFLTYDKICLDAAIEVLCYVEENTGLKISYEKSTVYRIGSCNDSDAKMYTIKQLNWSSGDINTLGITITNGKAQHAISHLDTIQQMCDTLKTWSNRCLSLSGKVLILNTLCASLFVYKMAVLPNISTRQIDNINKIINTYLWNGKRVKIPLEILQNDKKMGGLRLCNFEFKQKALKIQWVKKALVQPKFAYIYQWLIPEIGCNVWELNISRNDINSLQLPMSFWKEVWQHWSDIHFTNKIEELSISEEIIWFNSNIRIDNEICYHPRALAAGLKKLDDIMTNSGELMAYEQMITKFGTCLTWLEYAGHN